MEAILHRDKQSFDVGTALGQLEYPEQLQEAKKNCLIDRTPNQFHCI